VNYLYDLTGKGALFASPTTVLSVSTDENTAGYARIVLADGAGAIKEFVVRGCASSIAERIDELFEEIDSEEYDEADYDNREDTDGDE
jgi:hypothetical protein